MNYKQRSLTIKEIWIRFVLAIFGSAGLLFVAVPTIAFLLLFGYLIWAVICVLGTLGLIFFLVWKMWHPVYIHRHQLKHICKDGRILPTS